MLFNSLPFIFVYLPIVLLGFYLIRQSHSQLVFLLLSSIAFYCYWSPKLVFFLLMTVFLDFYIAKAIFKTPSRGKKRLLIIASMSFNLTVLGFFKYYNLFEQTTNGLFQMLGGSGVIVPVLNVILPIGISFYTFQSMSYVIDVYRGTSDAHANLLAFASYVTLFPHQISGPLVRHNKIVPQLENPQTYFYHADNFWKGCTFFVFGLSKKILVADLISVIVGPIVTNMQAASNLEAILAILGYTMQLYYDFSGYSDMAVGLGLMMNIQFPQNFNSPYKSQSITEFWQRWHISLSAWLKDYLYISLGGNRDGKLKTYRNLLVTMVLGGLWHGGNWTYVAWGFFHGVLLAIERFFKDLKINFLRSKILKVALTFFLVNLGWVFFRAPNFSTAFLWFKKIFLLNRHLSWDITSLPERYRDRFFVALGLGTIAAFIMKNTWQFSFKPKTSHAVLIGFLFALCLMFMGEESPFLYFQF